MSQAGGPSGGRDQIAAANIAVTADLAGLEAKLKEAEAKVNASAQKMGAAAKVPVGGGGAGGASPVAPLFDPASLRSASGGTAGLGQVQIGAQEAEQATKGLVGELSGAARMVAQIARGFGLMATAAYAVVAPIKAIYDYLNRGEIAATRFLAAIGEGVGSGAADRLATIRKQLQELDKVIDSKADRSVFGIAKDFIRGDTVKAAQDQQKELQASLRRGEDQVIQQRALREKGERENSKQEAAEFGREMDAAERERDQQQRDESEKRDRDEHQNKLEQAEAIGKASKEALDPKGAKIDDFNEQFKQIAAFRAVAQNEMEKAAADMWERSLINASEKWIKAFESQVKNAFIDAMNSALNASNNGSAQIPTILSQMSTKMDVIRTTIPREGFQ